jgi:glycosyltransferase involved in cell wall biosynthesis
MNVEQKPLAIVRAPVQCRAGYGDFSRDIVRHLIEYDKYDVKVHSVPWGDTPMTALDETVPKDKMILDRIIRDGQLPQPELYVTITIPTEFEPMGKYNIGITAGIETTVASAQWIEACNRMNLVLTTSEHSKNVFHFSKYTQQDQAGNKTGELVVSKPIEVLHCCIDNEIFKKLEYNFQLEPKVREALDSIPEEFCYLFVGHWLRGEFGEDRKNVALLVKIFLETFRQAPEKQKPALILKTSSAGFSILDREEILKKIDQIRSSVNLEVGQTMPNIYLVHGELTDKEMNSLYNHSKIKAHVSFTKGEGFGRPLLEASISGKPVIASGWSGQLDFLDKENSVLIGGELKPIHESSVWDGVLIRESTWFAPDMNQSANALYAVFKNYTNFKKKANVLAKQNIKKFSYETIRQRTFDLLDKYVPEFPKQMKLVLPTLKKIE